MTLIYSPERMEIDLNGKRIRLKTREALVMELLYKANGNICSYDDLGVFIYGVDSWYDGNVNDEIINIYISQLRKRLASYGYEYIKTVPGKGWYFSQSEAKSIPVKTSSLTSMALIYVPEKMQIDLNGRLIRLTTKEAAVMELLWKSDGDICSVDDIGVFIYGIDWYNLEISCIGVIEKLISRLRKRLAPYGHQFIKTVTNSGWYFTQYEPDKVTVDVTPAEAKLLRFFRAMSPVEQEMIIASQTLAASEPPAPKPAPRVRRTVEQPVQPSLFDSPA